MEANQSTLIIIQSDEEDDDVVWVKEEKAPEPAEKKDEDDVIFLSVEQVQPGQGSPEKQKKKSKRESGSSKTLSSEDEDDNFALPQFISHPSEYASISVEDDILRPLDFSQDSPQSSSSTQKLFQGPSNSIPMPEQLGKLDGSMDINPVKLQDDFFNTGKDLTGPTLVSDSSKSQRCSLLKLPEKPHPSTGQTLNTPVCKVVHWPETPDCPDQTVITSTSKDNLVSGDRKLETDKLTSIQELNKSNTDLAGSSTSPGQSIRNTISINGKADNALSKLANLAAPVTPSVIQNDSLVIHNSASQFTNYVGSVQTVGIPATSDICIAGGSSLLPTLDSNSNHQLPSGAALPREELYIPKCHQVMSRDKTNTLKLKLDNLSSDEMNTMLAFLSTDNKPTTSGSSNINDSNSQDSQAPDATVSSTGMELQSKSVSDQRQADHSYTSVSGDKQLSEGNRSSPHSTSLSSASSNRCRISKKKKLSSDCSTIKPWRPHQLKKHVFAHSKEMTTSHIHLCMHKKKKHTHSYNRDFTADSKDNDPACATLDKGKHKKLHSRKAIVCSKHSALGKHKIAKSENNKLSVVKKAKILEAPSVTDPGNPSLKMKLKLIPSKSESSSASLSSPQLLYDKGYKKAFLKRQKSMIALQGSEVKQTHVAIHRSFSENFGPKGSVSAETEVLMECVTCKKDVFSSKLSKCGNGHGVCVTCLELQVKDILSGDVKPKNIKCPAGTCVEILSFDELKQTLPSFVVDILEEKLDKEYLSYITKWMFTDEQIKSRSEFATSDTKTPLCPALKMRKYEEIYTLESRDPTEDLPTFWTPMERGAPVMVYEVVPDTEEYTALAVQFHETLRFPEYDIVRIIRVQNPILWKYFALKRSEMVQDNDGMDVTEKQLYHGTYRSTLEAIARKGFDWRLSGKHGTVFGCGSYFAKNARYSHGYTDRGGSGTSVKSAGPATRLAAAGLRTTSDPTMVSLNHQLFGQALGVRARMLSHALRSSCALSLSSSSQNLPPQPPPAHYHLPPPPPAHGQMSSLQLQAHNKNSCSSAMTSATVGMAAASSSLAASNPTASKHPLLPSLPAPPPFQQPGLLCAHQPQSPLPIFIAAPFHPMPAIPAVGNPHLPNNPGPSSSSKMPVPAPGSTAVTNKSQTLASGSGGAHNYNVAGGSNASNSNAGQSRNPLAISDMLQWAPPGYNRISRMLDPTPGCSNTGSSDRSNSIAQKDPGDMSGFQNDPSTSKTSRAQERVTSDLTAVFSRDSDCETHCMFVARVLVGRHTGGKAGLKRPPPLDDKVPFGKSYDSCVDDIYDPQVYVIFDSHQAYPEYVIEYNWNRGQDL